tara:strand:- start:2883 stop:3083 length:201 start_codon:yes stop_codon:yes gene_type:complete
MFRFIGSLLGFAKVLTQFFRERRLVALGEEKANAKAARKSLGNIRRALDARRNKRVPDDRFDRDNK